MLTTWLRERSEIVSKKSDGVGKQIAQQRLQRRYARFALMT